MTGFRGGAPTSPGVGLIPFVEHDDANRQLMGAKHQQQVLGIAVEPVVGPLGAGPIQYPH